jgi:hypothetical protein
MKSDHLYDADALMADGGKICMTAAEEVLAYLLVEIVGVPDDEGYSPNRAQVTIEAKLKAVAKQEATLAAKDAEIARYRKALSEILGYDRNFYDNGRPGYEAIARAALADEAEGRS